MAHMGRPGLSPQQKAELWKRRKGGESLSDIARALKKGGRSIFGVLRLRGGIAPRVHHRSRLALSPEGAEAISRDGPASFLKRPLTRRLSIGAGALLAQRKAPRYSA